ncbi:hypothetical protein M3231_06345 [Neobacillus mesonae]|nr:hypothetical protein [Neobacillus mesonae]
MMKIRILLILLLTLTIAGCGQNNETAPSPEPGTDHGIVEPSEPEAVVKEATGTFTGLADSHTVEIVIDGEPTAFQLGEDMQDAVADIEENAVLTFKYEEQPIDGEDTLKQLVLIEITEVESSTGSTGGSEPPEGAESSDPAGERPAVSEIELQLEGMTEKKEAELVHAQDGYSLYVFDIFTFNPETGVLSMDVDPAYEVKISQKAGDTDLEVLREEGITNLSPYGDVEEFESEGISESGLSLKVRDEATSTAYEYIVKDMDSTWFIYQITIPQGEPTEGFIPHAYASLNTIELEQE